MENIIRPENTPDVSTYYNHVSAQARMNQKPLHDGMTDLLGEVRLRIAFIENPEIVRKDGIDYTDVTGVVNNVTGKVTLKWTDLPGGVIRPPETGGKWENLPTAYDPDDKTRGSYKIDSKREMVELTSPFIWANNSNWCGFSYLPPVGSKVIVGFRKQGFPLILGYLNPNFLITKPVLEPGETCIKGYGNNYIHFRQSDKLDLKCWSGQGEVDTDDDSGEKTNDLSTTLWIRMDANNNKIKISAGADSNGSGIELSPSSLTMSSSGSDSSSGLVINSGSVTINTTRLTINSDIIDMNANKITQN